jgi:hypothetical protein
MTRTPALLFGILLMVVGCHSETKPPPAEARESANPSVSTIRTNQDDVATLADAVRNARDATAEADALRALQKYQTDHAMTYDIKAVGTLSGRTIASPQLASEPVRVTMTTYRGQQPVYTFIFVPKDNRNLALLIAQ